MINWSSLSFIVCFSTIFSSMVFLVIRRYTLTYLVCPILWALSIACKSIWGFQSLSYKTTVLAVIKLRPRPPALVEIRNTTLSVSGEVKSSICNYLSSSSVFPSNLQYLYSLKRQKSSRMSSIEVNPEKIKDWLLSYYAFLRSLSSTCIFPLDLIMCSPSSGASSGSMPWNK